MPMCWPLVVSGHVVPVTWCDLSPERPLHFAEKVLPILHGLGMDSYLVVKKHQSMEAMLLYLGRWCYSRYREGGTSIQSQDSTKKQQLRCRIPGGQAFMETGAGWGSFLHLGTWPPGICGHEWGAWHSPCPLQSSSSQPCG
jgi:hypothetical protein